MEAEAKQLVDAPFGETLVKSIAWVYENRAAMALGATFGYCVGIEARRGGARRAAAARDPHTRDATRRGASRRATIRTDDRKEEEGGDRRRGEEEVD